MAIRSEYLIHNKRFRGGAAARKSSSVASTRVFNPKLGYDVILTMFREDFDKRWVDLHPSAETGLEGYLEVVTLGEGSFGKVKLVKEKKTGAYFATKLLMKDKIVRSKQVAHIYNEKRVLQSIRFPFTITLEFSRKDNDCLYLGLPYICGGELFSYHRKVNKFNERQARFYTCQIFLALEYLHNVQLVYRDLKPENIVIDERGYCKLTDFGFAKKVTSRTLTLCGTPEYLAPEIIKSKPYGNSVDWWSFGVLVFELVAGYSPFSPHNRDVMTMYAKICEGDYRIPQSFSSTLRDLVGNLLQVDVTKRYGLLNNGSKDIKEHEWYKSIDWFSILNQEVIAPYVPVIHGMEDTSNFDKYPESKPHPRSKTCRHADLFADF